MTLVGIIVAVIGILIVFGLWLLFVLMAFTAVAIYKKATVVDGVIVENMGNVKYSTGHVTVGVPKFRTFYKYKVSINVDGQEQVVEAELANRTLKEGDHISVRYSVYENNEINIASTARIQWAMEMAIGYTLGIIFAIVLCILYFCGVI